MLIAFLYAIHFLLLLSCVIAPGLKRNEQRVSLSLIQVLIGMPLLAGQYIYCVNRLATPAVYPLLFLAETAFAILWLTMAYRLSRHSENDANEPLRVTGFQMLAGLTFITITIYFWNSPPAVKAIQDNLIAPPYGVIYFHSLALLPAALGAAWRLEIFWRRLAPTLRWTYKFLVIGSFLTCAILIWAASYRLTYQRIAAEHLTLSAILTLTAWLLIAYAVVRHRLLNRKIFISRKIIYSFVAPTIFAAYLILLGIIGLIMRTFGIPLPNVLQWLALALGLLAIGLFLFSQNLRRRAHFFISTHFYINKYEYRDEWLALSARLQHAATEPQVVMALYEVLKNSLYANHITIWIGDMERGFSAITPSSTNHQTSEASFIVPGDPLVGYLTAHPYLYTQDKSADPDGKNRRAELTGFLRHADLVLLAPLHVGDQLVGIIGLGPEFTGGRYGHDDFDLLAALGIQTASALMAVRMAEKLAETRERQAWHNLSAFILHDIKNAASMLSLVRANAPGNIHNPDFQKDMLEAIDDALTRMNKVQQRLDLLKEEIEPQPTPLNLSDFLQKFTRRIAKRLTDMTIHLQCPPNTWLNTDPQLLNRILENLLLNAHEANTDTPAQVDIAVETDPTQPRITITITDNGPGIPPHLLPDTLFAPLKTTKPHGSGIGLWQVKQLITNLNGSIQATNTPENHARFTIHHPTHPQPPTQP
ncbi:XrtA/PEP-CTERM system histidine kinase PrsK [Desulfatitalea alkaliphila]|uniref:histidine kinase n=1 Tax=Desulfatitalea alkaliphila TaxID=2929485 RepID=A0AA41R7K2_9BACT|nr:XrtA/PEP-CTERM system histidine kinase PrsK [Desulfatitalea alkaliphila]MCJ8502987.1 PEP-CTERM system histidine kinase PrsK [Desulfatitalea alkaliphila]